MVGLDKALEEWLETVQNVGNLSFAEQSRITQAGAEVFKEERSEERRVGKECRSRWSPYH